MRETNYSEIQFLQKIYLRHKVSARVSDTDFLAGNKEYPAVVFSLNNSSFKLYVEDEYKDLQIGNPILTLCLILRELENYMYEGDYLEWCKSQTLEPESSQVRDYYMKLGNIYMEVEKILGKINSHISNFDFELNAGAAQELRKSDLK